MTSLIAIPLLVLWVLGGVALVVGGRTGSKGWGGRFMAARPAVAVLWLVTGAWLVGWLLAVTSVRL